jgi:hypothetical protein
VEVNPARHEIAEWIIYLGVERSSETLGPVAIRVMRRESPDKEVPKDNPGQYDSAQFDETDNVTDHLPLP